MTRLAQALGPVAYDAFAIFEDLCLSGNGERPQFVQSVYFHSARTRPLFSSWSRTVLTNYHELFRKVCLSSPLPIRDLYAASSPQITPHSQNFELLL